MSQAGWNILVYIAADNDLATSVAGILAKLGKVVTKPGVTLFIQATVTPKGSSASKAPPAPVTTQYAVTKGVLTTLGVLGGAPVNTASPDALTAFLRWGVAKAPASQVALIMVSHGDGVGTLAGDASGLHGSLRDGTAGAKSRKTAAARPHRAPHAARRRKGASTVHGGRHRAHGRTAANYSRFYRSSLSIPSLAKGGASGRANGVDVLIFDMCAMAQIELVYELRDVAQWVVASEGTVPMAGFPYDTWLSSISAADSPQKLATDAVDAFADSYASGIASVGMSALQSSGVTALANKIDALAKLLVPASALPAVAAVQDASLAFSPAYFLDLAQVVQNLGGLEPTIPGIGAASQAVVAAMKGVVVSTRSVPPSGAGGLAIVFPETGPLISSYADLQFHTNAWFDFLTAFVAARSAAPSKRTAVKKSSAPAKKTTRKASAAERSATAAKQTAKRVTVAPRRGK